MRIFIGLFLNSFQTFDCPSDTEIFYDGRGNQIRKEGKPLCCGIITPSSIKMECNPMFKMMEIDMKENCDDISKWEHFLVDDVTI